MNLPVKTKECDIMKKLTAIIIGAGDRGTTYAIHMSGMKDKFDVVGVAEPKEGRRNRIKEMFSIPEERCFEDYNDLLALGKIADIAVIATMDRDHYIPTMKAIELKYDLLLEKPVSPDPKECLEISEFANKNGVKVLVCHVLRYTPFFNKIKDLIDEGKLGDIISITHEECVGNVHQSHSFVRGNWGNSVRSSFMLLQKSCHDMDILQWLIGKKCKKVQSFGTLTYFTEKNAPKGAPERCIDGGCPINDTCPYNSVKLYYDDKDNSWFRCASTGKPKPTDEDVENALRTTQYGKCVFKCDNDVVDHQTVNLLFEDDITVSFSMVAFNKGGRFIHIMGTKGELRGAIDGNKGIEFYDFETKEHTEIPIVGKDGVTGGHAGGDKGIVEALYDLIALNERRKSVSEIGVSCDNHLIVFAAEKARKSGTIIDLDEFKAELSK